MKTKEKIKIFEDWEKILEKEWLWIEEEQNEINYSVSEILSSNNDNINDFKKLSEKIEKRYNVSVCFSSQDNSLYILDKNNDLKLIWEVFLSEYEHWLYLNEEHLYFKIEEGYRWKWWWKKIFELYELLCEENEDFFIPDEECTNIVSMIHLYKKFWYICKYKIVDWLDEKIELEDEDFKLIDKTIRDFKKWKKEDFLPFTIILEREGY